MSSPFTTRRKASVADVVPDTAPSQNFAEERLVGMTFNMPVDWHKRFKRQSVEEGISMKDLLIKSFDAYMASK